MKRPNWLVQYNDIYGTWHYDDEKAEWFYTREEAVDYAKSIVDDEDVADVVVSHWDGFEEAWIEADEIVITEEDTKDIEHSNTYDVTVTVTYSTTYCDIEADNPEEARRIVEAGFNSGNDFDPSVHPSNLEELSIVVEDEVM